MIFTAEHDGSYLCHPYRLIPDMVGFGMQVCTVLLHGDIAHRTVGQTSLQAAQAWCRTHAAQGATFHAEHPEQHENNDGV
jgi:hypothetical protein